MWYFKEAEKWKKIQNLEAKKSALLWLKSYNFSETYFNKVKFGRNFRSCSKNWIKKQYGRFVAMATKDLQTLNLKFDQVMFNSLEACLFEIPVPVQTLKLFTLILMWMCKGWLEKWWKSDSPDQHLCCCHLFPFLLKCVAGRGGGIKTWFLLEGPLKAFGFLMPSKPLSAKQKSFGCNRWTFSFIWHSTVKDAW